ncbi:MAG: glycerol kinase [Desulfuromonas sp.]|nr:MAG: glycerol kinase [Desulfuromonas sp.]
MNERHILAIDQGTTSSRAMIFSETGSCVIVAQQEFPQYYPHDGWVEHNPEDIWNSVVAVCRSALEQARERGIEVVGIGITNQRETTLVWDRITGRPVYNAIVWQDRRTADLCARLKAEGREEDVAARTGLLLDPYFSATKLNWLLDNVAGARSDAEAGRLAFGTIDSFILWRLTGGSVHATDATNASRTMLYNIHSRQWDEELLELFRIPEKMLPQVKGCAAEFGMSDEKLFGVALPIAGIAGDQQAAAIGQACFEPGMIKSTYGTGCFVLLNTGATAHRSQNRLLTTIAFQVGERTDYAIEGSIFVAGAAIQWIRDGIRLISSAGEVEGLARQLESNKGVYMVPAFTGLGAPHWDPHARGAIFGLTRDTGIAEIVRATLESIGYQTHDLMAAMQGDSSAASKGLRVDGGMTANNWFLQFLADLLGVPVERPRITETTALGAAYLAGLQLGLYDSFADIAKQWQRDALYEPRIEQVDRDALLKGWRKAVSRVLEGH